MADIEKVITDLEKVKDGIEWDSPPDYQIMIDEAIQTIRELQEKNKWHYCNDEFPKESGHYLVVYHKWSDGNFLPKYDDTRVRTMHFQNSDNYVGWNYPICCDERAEKDSHREVIAWMELPRFDSVEQK